MSLIMVSFNGEYIDDYFIIGVFDKKHLALGEALKALKKMKDWEKHYPSAGQLINKYGREIAWSYNYYKQFEFKAIWLNERI